MAFIQFQLRRGTSTEWTTANPTLAEGEIGLETNTKRFKIGDGTTLWNSLPYGGNVTTTDIQDFNVVNPTDYQILTYDSSQSAWINTDVLEQNLLAWTESSAYQATAPVFGTDQIIASSTVIWPDGSNGTFTTVTKNDRWKAVDSYTVTHSDSGKIVIQSDVSRDAFGNVTIKPELYIS
jgi:hypothetical protein